MSTEREIIIAGRVYRKNPEVDRYQIHINELGDLRMSDIPPHSHLEILEQRQGCQVYTIDRLIRL
jgi:hypothetical protein